MENKNTRLLEGISNVVIGAMRNAGSFKDEKGNDKAYDNIVIYTATFQEGACRGFGFTKDGEKSMVKIKTSEFQKVTGINPAVFLKVFEEKVFLHQIRVSYTKTKFGRDAIERCRLSKEDCYQLYEQLKDTYAAFDEDADVGGFDSIYDDVKSDLFGLDDVSFEDTKEGVKMKVNKPDEEDDFE